MGEIKIVELLTKGGMKVKKLVCKEAAVGARKKDKMLAPSRQKAKEGVGAVVADAKSGQSSSDGGQGLTGTDVAEFLTDLLVSPSEAQ